MNKQDYEQKRRECWESFKFVLRAPYTSIKVFHLIFDRAYALGKQEKDKEKPGYGQTIKGWVACDKDGMLRLHYDKPGRTDGGYWQGGFKSSYLPTAVVLPIVWESDPIEVDVTIKPHLTSDAEEEEMLTVPRSKVQEMWQRVYEQEAKYSKTEQNPTTREELYYNRGIMSVIDTLFGPKCLPDKNSPKVERLEKNDEPKYHKGEKVMHKGVLRVIDLIDTVTHRYHLSNGNYYAEWVDESDLEPYTEPDTSHETPVCENHSDNTSQKEVNVNSNRNLSQETANCDKEFDNILKDSFSKERRLNIAAMAMQGILSNSLLMERKFPVTNQDEVVHCALAYADALISKCESSAQPLCHAKKGGQE